MKKSKDVVVVQEVDKYTVTRLLIPENKEGGRLLNTHSQGRPTTTTTATTTLATSAMTLNVATHSLLHATHSTPTLSPGFSLCNTLQRYTRSGFSLCKTLHTNALATSASTLKAAGALTPATLSVISFTLVLQCYSGLARVFFILHFLLHVQELENLNT
ncbi:hypothetical protein Pcinc_012619 [Petrolisthes cinctipes]|uniref:Uncharacterized protein n=1 Tax=Petrolisthes cinctipes TaxID=88211 RepID=A0AAE1KSE4_PETCI|nr:hypothetical protein Pcinc_012619 [Petrolisthes cinctipes]